MNSENISLENRIGSNLEQTPRSDQLANLVRQTNDHFRSLSLLSQLPSGNYAIDNQIEEDLVQTNEDRNLARTKLENLPYEIIFEIALQLDDRSLDQLCLTSKSLAAVCQDSNFWQWKFQRKFPNITSQERIKDWKRAYSRMATQQVNSPLIASTNRYGIIDQTGMLYMVGQNIWNGSLTSGKYVNSEIPIRMPFPPRVLSFSDNNGHMVVLMENGIYHWYASLTTRPTFNNEYMGRTLTNIKDIRPTFDNEYLRDAKIRGRNYKPVKILGSEEGYLLLMDDGSLLYKPYDEFKITVKTFNGINIFSNNTAKYTTLSDEIDRYFVLSKGRNLYHIDISNADSYNYKITTTKIPLPELVREYTGTNNLNFVLSVTGKIYLWKDDPHLDRMPSDVISAINIPFPKPIASISSYNGTIAAISVDGDLYMWGNNYGQKIAGDQDIVSNVIMVGLPIGHDFDREEKFIENMSRDDPILKIDIGQPINYISIGDKFTIALTEDGLINYWGIPILRA